MEGTTITVKLGARTLEGSLPASYSVRHEIVAAAATNVQRAFAAALGVCVPRVERMLKAGGARVSYEASGFSPLKYGGQLIDGLHGAGVSLAEIVEAGAECFKIMAESLLSEAEVKAAEGNSEPPTGA
jgi:hypothetical protein